MLSPTNASLQVSPTLLSSPDRRREREGGLRVAMIHLSDFRLDSRIQRQARALAERGDEVDLLCIGEREVLRVGEGTIRTHPLAATKPQGGGRAYVRGYGEFLLRALWCLTMLDRARRYDLIEAHNMPDILTAAALGPRLRGTPVILNVHDTFPELFATKFGWPDDHAIVTLLKREERISAAFATRVITVTDGARRRLEGRGVGVGRTVVVMNSPDERVFGPPRVPVSLPEKGPLRVLYHGGLAPRFGVETLIRAFERLRVSAPRVQLRVCGSGEDRDRLAALAAQIDPQRIDIAAEPTPFAQIPAELEAAHIGVVPTLHDGFTELLLPVKLLEYAHMGLPIASSRLPGIAGYFSERELCEFEPGDADDLARAIESIVADPVSACDRAARATERLQGIAWKEQRERYLGLVDELTASQALTPVRASASTATLSASPTTDSPLSRRG
ncbi:MAG: glycosyltransferase family 4 protein [Solirubrobacteraceae bacterium]